ncbi:Gfo/Idh/MocA family protein [Microbulbifer spongiae]|uniref:Gfo/Idh/MocA family oxidoreductase n=1 Tax=Microbulbifer spongiae TaxID=2944933 RepID=A0ABY9EH48_9GAMM|nr:Gfo/Idh/MocA family oxidoreductase [Microbulbifer sp. MI-G]WKD51468.1 Gfo/Idh/MocA family oxidoreductase [Microbulbifer sp. MI-G]
MDRKVRMGMVGGGEGGFIGPIHRMAAALDGEVELVAGCFSRDPGRARSSGEKFGLPADRVYSDYQQMIRTESARSNGGRMEFVAVVTPNHWHLPVSVAALEAGFHVLSDKPAACTLEEVLELKKVVEASGCLYGLTHTYAAYPLVMQAREMVQSNMLGPVRRVGVTYAQGWLAQPGDTHGSKQANWRTDPRCSGESGCFADIGTHAHHLVEYITGQWITAVCADLQTAVAGRHLDDDGAALFKLENGARGTLTASQVCGGEGNNLNISVHCELGSLFWEQETPDRLQVKRRGQADAVYRAGVDSAYLAEKVRARLRTPRGHPEGYIEAFANLYRDFAAMVRCKRDGRCIENVHAVGDIAAGVRGMAFVRGAIESSGQSAWVPLTPYWNQGGSMLSVTVAKC